MADDLILMGGHGHRRVHQTVFGSLSASDPRTGTLGRSFWQTHPAATVGPDPDVPADGSRPVGLPRRYPHRAGLRWQADPGASAPQSSLKGTSTCTVFPQRRQK